MFLRNQDIIGRTDPKGLKMALLGDVDMIFMSQRTAHITMRIVPNAR